MARHHMVNNEKVMFTAEEETARDAEEKAWEDEKPVRAFAGLRSERNRKLKRQTSIHCRTWRCLMK